MFNQMHVGAFGDEVLIEDPELERSAVAIYNACAYDRGFISDWGMVCKQSKDYYRMLVTK